MAVFCILLLIFYDNQLKHNRKCFNLVVDANQSNKDSFVNILSSYNNLIIVLWFKKGKRSKYTCTCTCTYSQINQSCIFLISEKEPEDLLFVDWLYFLFLPFLWFLENHPEVSSFQLVSANFIFCLINIHFTSFYLTISIIQYRAI